MSVSQEFLEHSAYQLRVDSLRATTQAGSGHPTSCLSAADLVAAIFFYAMRDDDHFILSKGHAAPVLYAMYKQLGLISDQELLSLRTFGSPLEGHPTPRCPYVEAATGSLGQGLSIGIGMALTARLNKVSYYVYVLLGDAEMAEGSNWEAINYAAHTSCENIIAFVDVNRLGQSDQTIEGHDTNRFKVKFEAFGWRVLMIDGHNMAAIMQALDEARQAHKKPTVILAKTFKGHGLDAQIENYNGFHGKAFSSQELPTLLEQLEKTFSRAAGYQSAENERSYGSTSSPQAGAHIFSLPKSPYAKEEKVATRHAYGYALVELGKLNNDVISLDGEVKNSTGAEYFEQQFPDRFFQCFVAEQNMVGMGVGFAARGKMPFVSTFAAFYTRAHDHIRMAAISGVAMRMVGSHAGVSIGEDGPSQMGLEDIALFRSLPHSIILYPCDGVSTFKLLALMANYHDGISYLRTTRMATPIVYDDHEEFVVGGCKVLRSSNKDCACIVAAGVTVFEALKAYDILRERGIYIRVIDCYSVKPLPTEQLIGAARACKNHIITVEDHYVQGGLGEAVCYVLRNHNITVECLAVKDIPGSGKPAQLLAAAGIDSAAIIQAVKL